VFDQKSNHRKNRAERKKTRTKKKENKTVSQNGKPKKTRTKMLPIAFASKELQYRKSRDILL
jgi:hypothetical protein